MEQPTCIIFDLTRMATGGNNGGVKIHLFTFIRELVFRESQFRLGILCEETLVPELSFLYTPNNFHQIHIIRPKGKIELRDVNTPLPIVKKWPNPPGNFMEKLGADVLYAGFGFSEFHCPKVTQISLIVDCLHIELPEHLPQIEVDARKNWYPVAIEQANIVQTNSDYCIKQLVDNFNIDSQKILRIYLPLQERFNTINIGPIPQAIEGKKYFLYPAHLWSHKNHETLLIAYNKYLRESKTNAWDLVLTGANSENNPSISNLIETLGLSQNVHLLGHLPVEVLKHVWAKAGSLVFPSLYEGFGLPILEAMHFKVPITCSKTASLPEVAHDVPLYFSPRNPTEIAHCLERISNDDQLRNQLIQKGTERLQAFNLDDEVETLIRTINELVMKAKEPVSNVDMKPSSI